MNKIMTYEDIIAQADPDGKRFECDCCGEELPVEYRANDDDQCVWCLAAILSFKEAGE